MGLFNKKTTKEEQNAPSMQELAKVKKEAEENKKPATPTKPSSAYEKYKNVDWSKVSRDKVFEVMADVMNENKRLTQENNRLYSEIEHNYKERNTHAGPSAKGMLEEIAQRISPQLIVEINSGKSFKEIEMQEYIINSVLSEKNKYLNKILQMTEKEKLQKELLTELQNQVYDMIAQNNKRIEEEEEVKPFTEEEFKNLALKNVDEETSEEKRKANLFLKAIPLEKARTVFNEQDSLAVIKAVGIKGLSEFPEISKYVKENDGVSENRLETVINNLEKESVIEVVRINTFQRNTGLRLVKLNDEIGIQLFKEVFKKEPVKSEMQIIRAENDNYEHGYNIKETCEILKKNYGYEDVSMERKKNTITVSNMNTWIPDIIAINPISKKKEYFEVEMGTHNVANFNTKLDKALLITNELKIIVPNKMKADELLNKVKVWYNSKKSRPTIVIKIYTYVEFKRKEESRIYPFVVQEKNILGEIMDKEKDKVVENNQKNPSNNNQNNQNNQKNNKIDFKNSKNNPPKQKEEEKSKPNEVEEDV